MSKYNRSRTRVNGSAKAAKSKSPRSNPSKSKPPEKDKKDLRKQLCNDRKVGPIAKVQLPTEMIARLWGILFDIDPDLFRKKTIPADVRADPRRFYHEIVRLWLARHPALQDAEVRLSGRGLHIIIWFTEPVEFSSEADRQRWAGIVRAVQAVLPTDPDCPGITATTRALGSINSKNNAVVEQLAAGKPVEAKVVLELFEQLHRRPFRIIMAILLGSERCKPCPVCGEDGSNLSALDFVGRCYGCGKVPLSALYDVFLRPRPALKKDN